jgi:hypothetical protein
MTASTLHEQSTQFTERNTFLYLALGLVSFAQTLEHLAVRHGPPPSPAIEETTTQRSEHELTLLAALGMLSLSNQVLELVREVPVLKRVESPEVNIEAHLRPRDLAR